jgi:hypothetical protein
MISAMNQPSPAARIRRQRNVAIAVAALVLVAGFGAVLHQGLARYRALRTARTELIDLQVRIDRLQRQVVFAQEQLVEQQARIRRLQGN